MYATGMVGTPSIKGFGDWRRGWYLLHYGRPLYTQTCYWITESGLFEARREHKFLGKRSMGKQCRKVRYIQAGLECLLGVSMPPCPTASNVGLNLEPQCYHASPIFDGMEQHYTNLLRQPGWTYSHKHEETLNESAANTASDRDLSEVTNCSITDCSPELGVSSDCFPSVANNSEQSADGQINIEDVGVDQGRNDGDIIDTPAAEVTQNFLRTPNAVSTRKTGAIFNGWIQGFQCEASNAEELHSFIRNLNSALNADDELSV
eukprot:Gregarina_sp_Poly_1__1330@NODE_132_length_13232_cov_209_776377_g118_i0_p8_GENE_NODE_132_length_13232_cov_209_776377_g118_i0NODE_132_length_13232_cov_209_776377_g118_i0_p8_ORF_typecomplete_len262_score21_74_NODE_132_length_13232_cov_209_776377_g118_i01146012245